MLINETIMGYIEYNKYEAACYCRLSCDDENDDTSVKTETQGKVKKLISPVCGKVQEVSLKNSTRHRVVDRASVAGDPGGTREMELSVSAGMRGGNGYPVM